MSPRVTILYNDDSVLAHGLPQDALALQAVIECARSVETACRARGWEARSLAAPLDPVRLLEVILESRGGVIFNLVEALGGDATLEPAVAYLLELAGVPYTGSPPRAMLLALEKPLARAVLAAHGVPLPAGAVLARGDEPLAGSPPWIVKPSREDASHGISTDSVALDEEAARARARFIIEHYCQPALVEEFVDGRELNVSIIGEGESATILPPGEIDFSLFPAGRPRLVTYEAKWVEGSPECRGTASVAARAIEPQLAARVAETALAAYRALGLRGYGRVDLRLHPQAGPLVIDVNPNPDLSPGAGLALAAARSGLGYEDLIASIVETAWARRR